MLAGFPLRGARSRQLGQTAYFGPHAAGTRRASLGRGTTVQRGTPEPAESERLTRREREVIELISDGSSNKEIAQRLCIAISTVKGHVHSILEKLTLRTRLQIAAYARNGYRATSAPPSSPVPPPAPSPPRVLRIERQSPPGRRRSIDG